MSLLTSGLNTYFPLQFSMSPDGNLYFCSGLDAVMRWDGQTEKAQPAGIVAPTSVADIAASSSPGTIYGTYTAYIRYIDRDDTPSNFSELTSITLTSGAAVDGFKYTAIPTSSNGRVTGREIWRSTAGQTVTFYKDATISDNATTTYWTNSTDTSLIEENALRFLTEDGYPNANRFVVPPNYMRCVVCFMDRMWYAVPAHYDCGQILSTSGTGVTSSGTQFTQQMIDRKLNVAGALPRDISAVPTATSLTLDASVSAGYGTANQYYSVSPGPAERNRIYFSEAGEPESVSSSFDLQEDDDVLTGLMPLYSYLYLLKERHIYRFSTNGEPRYDAAVGLVAERGCINCNCWVRVEGHAFMLDRDGVYLFDGNTPKGISQPIQDYFRDRINWSGSKWFSVAHSGDEETVRFFVAVDQEYYPQTALCYHYRIGKWEIEHYPFPVSCSTEIRIDGQERTIVGAEENVSLIDGSPLDGCASHPLVNSGEAMVTAQTLTGTVDSATTTTIIDAAADLDFSDWHVAPEDTGTTLHIVDSSGSSQGRRIASINNTTHTITVQTDFDPTPSTGDTWRVGAIDFNAKFGAFRWREQSRSNVRTLGARYIPQTEEAQLNLRVYDDGSSSPRDSVWPYSNEVGGGVEGGSPNFQIDVTDDKGYQKLRIDDGFDNDSPAVRTVELEIEGVSGIEPTEITEIFIDGADV